ncbi:MAG: hypothetical protein KatS3mg004_1744 [Bryobacteraceae bacterium]|nr:MAG: hypothetical protein KatS3mg004_1744 [Bryobacteraceae bacterium]
MAETPPALFFGGSLAKGGQRPWHSPEMRGNGQAQALTIEFRLRVSRSLENDLLFGRDGSRARRCRTEDLTEAGAARGEFDPG